jgi:hypothetical protein
MALILQLIVVEMKFLPRTQIYFLSLCWSKRKYPSLASSLSKPNTPLCTEMILLALIQI